MSTRAELLRQQIGFAHQMLEGTIADCDQKVLHSADTHWTISNVASIYAHAVTCEDAVVSGVLQGKPSVFESRGWESKLGVELPVQPGFAAEWSKTCQIDLNLFRAYANDVHEATDAYVARLSDADLDRKVATGMMIGDETVAFVLGAALVTHVPEHTGEIAALKGVHGRTGLPF